MTATASTVIDPSTGSHRNSPIPTGSMIMTRFMELRKRRGLMIALVAVNIGVPTIFLLVRLIAHAVDPHSYGPAGGSGIFNPLVTGVMYIFGFIVAATLGCTAGAVDLSDGMFRHLVVTGRSRVAIYFARIPAGLMIIVPIVATGIIIVSAVCVAAAPKTLSYDGISNVPVGLSRQGFVTWADQHYKVAACDLNFNFKGGPGADQVVQCGGPRGNNNPQVIKQQSGGGISSSPATKAEMIAQATKSANQDYRDYSTQFLKPSLKLIVDTGLWVELWAIIGFLIGLGLSSLIGQRTVPVVLLIVYEIILTPLFSRVPISHLIPAQRGLVGLAMANIEPSGLPAVFGGQGGGSGPNVGGLPHALTESTLLAWIIISAWIVIWTGLGAWRMATRDA
jgi:hypothetical protein